MSKKKPNQESYGSGRGTCAAGNRGSRKLDDHLLVSQEIRRSRFGVLKGVEGIKSRHVKESHECTVEEGLPRATCLTRLEIDAHLSSFPHRTLSR